MRKMARELKVHSMTVRNSVKCDLKLKSYTRTPKHLLTTAMKEKRLERCKKITTWLKKNFYNVIIHMLMLKSCRKILSILLPHPVDKLLNLPLFFVTLVIITKPRQKVD